MLPTMSFREKERQSFANGSTEDKMPLHSSTPSQCFVRPAGTRTHTHTYTCTKSRILEIRSLKPRLSALSLCLPHFLSAKKQQRRRARSTWRTNAEARASHQKALHCPCVRCTQRTVGVTLSCFLYFLFLFFSSEKIKLAAQANRCSMPARVHRDKADWIRKEQKETKKKDKLHRKERNPSGKKKKSNSGG